MIALGNYDGNIAPDALEEYKRLVKELTVVQGENVPLAKLRDEGGWAEFLPAADNDTNVREVQHFLKNSGFFPFGKIDGICGYRTTSAIRLFQEYVRTVEGKTEIGTPDGKFGTKSIAAMRRWQTNNQAADWVTFSPGNPGTEYATWMALLRKLKAHYMRTPGEQLKKVNAFPQPGDTVKVPDWDFDPDKIHIVGIRHRKDDAGGGRQVLDDVFILLIRGLVFKFFGSTEPGTKDEDVKEYPILVPGQHRYRFGWHKLRDTSKIYQALRPAGKGVLVLRSKNLIPTDEDLSGPLTGPNPTINIHWGGKGMTNNAGWSAGCQVIAGRSYINHNGQSIDCSGFAATTYDDLGGKTKGAYTVLGDIVASFSGDDNIVHYMLIHEGDLTLGSDIGMVSTGDVLSRLT